MMWVILPVKHLRHGKSRLKQVLSEEQRSRLSYLLLEDTIETLSNSNHVQGVTIISCDMNVSKLAGEYQSQFIMTDKDNGFSEDAMTAINSLGSEKLDKIAIIPADLPQLTENDLELLDTLHDQGVSLCKAEKDGGTNALVFTPPLTMPLLFGPDSFNKHQQAAKIAGLTLTVVQTTGMQRDIDREEDLNWLIEQSAGGKAWDYIREIYKQTV